MGDVTPAAVLELREAYRESRASIQRIGDGLEKEIGLATVRLEATQTYKQLVTTAPGVTDGTLAPLKEYVASVEGGEAVEGVVQSIDNQAQSAAKKALTDLTSSLVGGTFIGVIATIIGIATVIITSGENAGAGFATALIGGTVSLGIIGRVLYVASQGAEQTWLQTSSWAENVGRQSDAAMAKARELQRAVLQTGTGSQWVPQAFTAKARSRATAMVMGTWGLLILGLVLFAIGFVQGASEVFSQETSDPFTSP